MPKTKISEYSVTNSSNTDIEGINIDEGCAPSGINNAIRELMVHLKEFQTGASGDAFTFAGGVLISGTANTITGNVLMSGTNTITGSTTATFAAGAVGTPSIAAHGDTNTGIFFPAADTIAFAEGGAEAMRIDSSGNVGIGSTAPGAKFAVFGSFAKSSDENTWGIKVTDETAMTTGVGGGITFVGNYTTGGGKSPFGGIAGAKANSTTSNGLGELLFYTTNVSSILTERMRIDSSGNVGIGTSSPTSNLTIAPASQNEFTEGLRVNRQGQTGQYVIVNNSGGFARIIAVDTLFTSPTFAFSNSTDGSTATERARITSGGNFYVGTTSGTIDSSNFGFVVVSDGETKLSRNVGAASPSFTAYGNAGRAQIMGDGDLENTNGSYGALSDIKIKQDIADAASQWDDIKNIRVRKFRFKNNPTGFLQIGVVAQELEEVSPGLIKETLDYENVTKTREVEKTREVTPAVLDEDGNEIEPAVTETYTEEEKYTEREPTGTTTKSVKYSILYMKAVKALQEAMARIETLEAQNAAFEARLAALEAK